MLQNLMRFLLLLALILPLNAQDAKLLETSDLSDFEKLEKPRQKLIETSFAAAEEVKGMPYLYGGNGPTDGGFDCSGAIYYVLKKIGLKPPRTSSDQFLWVQKNSKFHKIPVTAKTLDDESFTHLKPGDLVFWSGTYTPTDGRKTGITHVAIYLGHEKEDARPVMINATSGRSYRGKKCEGFGVYDFRIPRPGSKSRIVGYGTPPGLIAE
ncbi:MAG: C40 family peptidase [Luteolibacter sp.]